MLKKILREKQSAILERWLADTLAAYQPSAAKLFRGSKDPFANPVGNALIRGMAGILDCLLTGRPLESTRCHLEEILKIRSVQDFSASQALSFLFLLKTAIRMELKGGIENTKMLADLTEYESGIDQIALLAFEIYTDCREQINNLRIDEVKRSVSAIMATFCRSTVKSDVPLEPAC